MKATPTSSSNKDEARSTHVAAGTRDREVAPDPTIMVRGSEAFFRDREVRQSESQLEDNNGFTNRDQDTTHLSRPLARTPAASRTHFLRDVHALLAFLSA